MSGYYDQNNVWHYNKTCIYDQYYAEGCGNMDGEYDEFGVWQYDDPCSLDDDDFDEDDCDDEDDNGVCVYIDTNPARNPAPKAA